MSVGDRDFLAELCAAKAGLKVDPAKPYVIDSRLAPVARREGFGSVDELIAAVRTAADERQVWAVVEAMAMAEGAFFRDRAVFEGLWREVVPQFARRRRDGVVRIWSAGCGAGQEIYSLAMLQADAPPPSGQVELFASDLSDRQLEKARAGLYSHFEVQRGLAAAELVRHFDNRDDLFLLSRRVREQVRWRRVNLTEDLTPFGPFDVVLCRYLLSAMTDRARFCVLANLAAALSPDGVLVLGANESASGVGLTAVPGLPGAFERGHGLLAAGVADARAA